MYFPPALHNSLVNHFAGMTVQIMDAQRQRRTACDVRNGPYLLDCPFCGIAPSVERRDGSVKIQCAVADDHTAQVSATSDLDAAGKWNRRRH